MEKPQKSDAEQLVFFEGVYDRFLKASAYAGEVRYYYRIGGTTVSLLFAGENLVGHLTPALDHLRIPDTGYPDLTLCIWDSESTSTEMVPPPCSRDCFTDRGDIWGFNSRRIKAAFHWIEYSVNLLDLATHRGIYWVQTAETLPYWVNASPLRTLFHWWMEEQGCQLLHAASVGTEHGPLLITGKGGVGKSTSALACLQSGFSYLADDYVVTALEPDPMVYSLYSTAKLDADNVATFPGLSTFIKNPEKSDREKAVMFLYPHLDCQIVGEMPLKAIVTPRVVDRDETLFVPVHPQTIQRAMSFTTMAQLPGVGRYSHDFISRLSTMLPCYTMELGRDIMHIPDSVSEFLAGLSSRQTIHRPADLDYIDRAVRPLVSVVIPVFNGERFIADAVDSVLSQNYPALEIIVVDDGSTDRTGEIIQQLNADIRYFKQENYGPASARNRGIRDASGEFIVFLDVDDLWPENNLNKLIEEMLHDAELEVTRGYAQMTEYNTDTGEYDFAGNPRESFPDYIGAAIYRKSAFRKVGLFDKMLKFGEDVDWFARAAEIKLKMKRLEEITLYVRRHGRNMTCGKNLLELNTLRVLKKSIDRTRAHAREKNG